MKRFLIAFILSGSCLIAQGQDTNSFMLGLGMDLIRTDNPGVFERTQIGLEGNYFFAPKFSGTIGLDFWSSRGTSVILGARFYPIQPVYFKLKGYIGVADDFTLGMGYRKSISSDLDLEGGMDYFFDANQLAIRFGLAYLF